MAATDGRGGKRPKSVWLTERPPLKRKADQPAGLDLDKIVGATVRLLDAEGLAKFSMRRLAAELGVTAMSVYWYVDTKDDLLELAVDAVAGEMRLPDESDAAADWRDQLRVLARAYRDMLLLHPWAARLLGEFLNIGPHSTAFSNATLRVMGRSGLDPERASGALAAVFHFVYGFATIRALHEDRCRAAGISLDDYFAQVVAAIAVRPEHAETMALSQRAAQAQQGHSAVEMLKREFTFALDLQIAGIETMRDRAGS
ncbi:TetR/AcrR family transcriptional regulator [Streptomyces pinistramenti]|uniref:TetR/AcrR family transcriptional regulator n=1 Tax=Streptomyces pinistramenti TaxID=2884812 RepID=UPI001D067B70|nr:TetR/AcrR family transcriptional regulator C-terminal domain-containing protein [Streptomyces pinistramenti]MCB5910827.1 TetR/AcrR family transcriptional regulator C-terminal domain-containing protein [Streptomyces pinistramenti]